MSKVYKAIISEGNHYLDKTDCPEIATIYISFASTYFYSGRLSALVNFAVAKFKVVEIVLTGVVYRNSYFAEEHLAESIRLGLAKNYEARYVKEQLSRFKPLMDEGRLVVRYAEEYLSMPRYEAIYDEVVAFHLGSKVFQGAQRESAMNMLKRANNQHSEEAIENHLSMRKDFILEELAIFACASESGRPLLIYPGRKLEIADNVCRGVYEGVPELLLSVQTVYITIAKSGVILRQPVG